MFFKVKKEKATRVLKEQLSSVEVKTAHRGEIHLVEDLGHIV